MKTTISNVLTALFFLAILASCNKEEVDTNIYAPNEAVVSASMEDLQETIANALAIKASDISVQSISFLDVTEGFAAEVDIHLKATDERTNVFYLSPELANNVRYEGASDVSEGATQRDVPYIEGTVASCECGSGPSSGCKIRGSLSGTIENLISIKCVNLTCSDCSFQM